MEDLEELAEAMGKDVGELYRQIRDDVTEEVRAERSLSNMLHAILLMMRANALYCRICLELIDNPDETARSVERRISGRHGDCRSALAVANEVSPELARAVEISRVLPEGVGRCEVVRARSTHMQNMKD